MSRIIKLFEHFVRSHDGMFYFLDRTYDVVKAWKMIEKKPEKFMPNGEYYEVDLDSLSNYFGGIPLEGEKSPSLGVVVDREYAMNIDESVVDIPGIFIKEGDSFHFLIDGWHRAYRKWKRGDKMMDTYLFEKDSDIKKIRVE